MFIGLDLGTSGIRAILVSEEGAVLDAAEAGLAVSRPHQGWSEQDPADWVAASRSALAGLSARNPTAFAAVRGIGLSGQMHGATLLDENGNVLRPCMLWNDTRSAVQAARLDAIPAMRSLSGNIVFPGFTAPKVAWVAEHEPEVYARLALVLLPKDYLSFWLTGRAVAEMSDAAGTAWLDVGRRQWSDELLESVLAQWGDQVAFYISQVAAERGEKDRAFELLERARRNGEPDLVMAVPEPMLRSLHNDPRWAQFRENIGRSEERLAAVEFEVSEPGG